MSGIFISHSSHDKEFVFRLAVDLVERDFDVWYDTWKLHVGAKLSETIRAAVGGNAFFVVVWSKSAAASEWVTREVAWALDEEESSGRTMLLPVTIDGTELPPRLRDRIYADLSTDYTRSLTELVAQLRDRVPAGDGGLPPEHELIPLVSTGGIHLDASMLRRRIEALRERLPADHVIRPGQLRIAPEPGYESLRTAMFHRLDHIAEDPYYTREFAEDYRNRCEFLVRKEEELQAKLADLLTVWGLRGKRYHGFADVSRWYWRLARTQLIGEMSYAQNPDEPRIDFGVDCRKIVYSNKMLERFYDVEDLGKVDLIPGKAGGGNYSAWIGADLSLMKRVSEYGGAGREPLGQYPDVLEKWILPQILYYEKTFDDWAALDTYAVGLG
ncbi:MAG TPA: toll/interleukin-1 receptor domain-containing protein [Actinophytocola sp.]|jgi:hypothetical protein|nr:toll/interleukin-1 receptor domain-containing protein [Actinophytocola sp.]